MEYCKICDNDIPYKRLDVHLRTAHNKMKREEYDVFGFDNDLEAEEFVPQPATDVVKIEQAIFGEKAVPKDINRPLKDFLDEFDISEKDLRAVVFSYKEGKPLPEGQAVRHSQELGIKGARELRHLKNPETYSLPIAEALVKHYGFTCVNVKGKSGNIPKKWILAKD